MAGASAGAAIGGWILGLLGLHALVEDLIGILPRALQYYQQGIQEAWRSSSENRSCSGPAEWNHGSLSQASFLLANGHVQMVIALLSALMLWISRGRGERANALQSINQSARLGPGFAKWIEANEEKLHTLLASRSRQGGGTRNSHSGKIQYLYSFPIIKEPIHIRSRIHWTDKQSLLF